jgi:hypothetical protein
LSGLLISAVSVSDELSDAFVLLVSDFSVGFSTVIFVGFLGGSTCFSVDEFFSSGQIVVVVNGATVVGFAGGDVMFTFGGSVGFLSSI